MINIRRLCPIWRLTNKNMTSWFCASPADIEGKLCGSGCRRNIWLWRPEMRTCERAQMVKCVHELWCWRWFLINQQKTISFKTKTSTVTSSIIQYHSTTDQRKLQNIFILHNHQNASRQLSLRKLLWLEDLFDFFCVSRRISSVSLPSLFQGEAVLVFYFGGFYYGYKWIWQKRSCNVLYFLSRSWFSKVMERFMNKRTHHITF